MWVAIARWALGFFARDLLLEYGWQIASTLVMGLVALVVTVAWALGVMAQPGGIYWLASQAPPEIQAQHPIAPIMVPAPLYPITPSVVGARGGSTLPAPPAEQWAVMQQAAKSAGGCTFDPVWLAAVAWYESQYGANPGPSSAGAWGYGQFMPETLRSYGISHEQARDYRVMLPAMATYLCRAGIATNVDAALWAYNHSQAYVEWVKYLASTWSKAATSAWSDGPPYNQFARSSWQTAAMFAAWAPAACSAASLAWLLRAYGRPVGALDDAIALENPPIGISTQKGLMDHTGTQLAVALTHQGLSGFKKHFTSTQDLVDGLRDGPLAMDGQSWFGVGHWFVAIGADAAGIAIRESSGNDIRYLTWQQLYGPVGWSGWAVGVLP